HRDDARLGWEIVRQSNRICCFISDASGGATTMSIRCSVLTLISIWFGSLGPTYSAESHRLLVLDVRGSTGAADSQVLLVEIESGNGLAKVGIGFNAEMAVSPKGDLVVAVYDYRVGGVCQGHSRLDFFRTSDLKRVGRGLLRFNRTGFQLAATEPIAW